ncbi:hypothetical protein HV782_009885 [Pseudomonas monsensis]|uniref:hypothetical protein n=1 Tax=Pseudomonas monsensis TaxID=2745509 RepID=UPI0016468958|nr:hypothetical protein [Pseudomonas monsensis]QXI02285.1 hypothetical protein HV782_009885 [Pseudomonas monsensis]
MEKLLPQKVITLPLHYLKITLGRSLAGQLNQGSQSGRMIKLPKLPFSDAVPEKTDIPLWPFACSTSAQTHGTTMVTLAH